MQKSFQFEKEFKAYADNKEKLLSNTIPKEISSFLKNSYNLWFWLKNHCY